MDPAPVHVNASLSQRIEWLRGFTNAQGETLFDVAPVQVDPDGRRVIAEFEGTFSTTGAAPTVRSRSRSTPRRRGGSTRAGNGIASVTPERIISWLENNPGGSAKDLAKALHISYDALNRRLKQLEDSHQVYREGERNQTRWYAGARAAVAA